MVDVAFERKSPNLKGICGSREPDGLYQQTGLHTTAPQF